MKYIAMGANYDAGNETNSLFGTNGRPEAVRTAENINPGIVVVEQSIIDQKRIVHSVA